MDAESPENICVALSRYLAESLVRRSANEARGDN